MFLRHSAGLLKCLQKNNKANSTSVSKSKSTQLLETSGTAEPKTGGTPVSKSVNVPSQENETMQSVLSDIEKVCPGPDPLVYFLPVCVILVVTVVVLCTMLFIVKKKNRNLAMKRVDTIKRTTFVQFENTAGMEEFSVENDFYASLANEEAQTSTSNHGNDRSIDKSEETVEVENEFYGEISLFRK